MHRRASLCGPITLHLLKQSEVSQVAHCKQRNHFLLFLLCQETLAQTSPSQDFQIKAHSTSYLCLRKGALRSRMLWPTGPGGKQASCKLPLLGALGVTLGQKFIYLDENQNPSLRGPSPNQLRQLSVMS